MSLAASLPHALATCVFLLGVRYSFAPGLSDGAVLALAVPLTLGLYVFSRRFPLTCWRLMWLALIISFFEVWVTLIHILLFIALFSLFRLGFGFYHPLLALFLGQRLRRH